jgi:hypothetical protein
MFDKSRTRIQASIRTRSTTQTADDSSDKIQDLQVVVCPRCQHNISLLDLLTTFRVPDRRDCPVCTGVCEKSLDPFSASECRLRYRLTPTILALR